MLDKKTELVLRKIKEYCEDGNYVTFSVDDFQVFGNTEASYEMIADILRFLKSRNYIEIRHQGEDGFCLTILSKGRFYEEEYGKNENTQKKIMSIIKFSFLGSLCGAFLGVFFATLVVEIIKLFV